MKKIKLLAVLAGFLAVFIMGCDTGNGTEEDVNYSGVLDNGASYSIGVNTATVNGEKITSIEVLMTKGEQQCGFHVDVSRDISLGVLSGMHNVSAFVRTGQTFTSSSFDYFSVLMSNDSIVSLSYTSRNVSAGAFVVSGSIQRASLQQLAAATGDAQFVFANQSSGEQIEDGIAIPIPYDFFKVLRKYV